MIRTIDLKRYLPPYLLEYKELNQILTVENERLQQLEELHWQMVDNRFIQSCDEKGIERFEKIVNASPLASDTLADRIARVMTIWNKMLPYNYKYMCNQLDALCGSGGYKITLDGLNLTVSLTLVNKNMITEAKKLLSETIPCNIAMEITLIYNTYKRLKQMKHNDISKLTHIQIREGVY